MEKLIELLNKYEKEIRKSEFYEWEKGVGGHTNLFRRDTRDEEGSHIYSDTADTYVISKKYGFIKWLVENDKIDIKELVKGEIKSGWEFEEYPEITEISEEYWNKYYSELCLMLLSIQDNPIDFLVSILLKQTNGNIRNA